MALYVVKTTYVPERNEERLAARPAHREWLTRLRGEKALVDAGPFADEHGALLLFQAPSEAELRDLLTTDPYPQDSLTYEVLGEWKPLFGLA